MAARCPQCSASLTANATVCPKCGFDLTASSPPTPAPSVEQPPRTPEIKLTIPEWLTVDWGTPARGALLTIAIGIALQYVVGILLVIGALIASTDQVPWADLARVPPTIWLTFNLGVHSVPFVLTGILWIRYSVRRSGRILAREIAVPRENVVQAASKFAVVYALIELGTAIALKSFTPGLRGDFQTSAFFPGFGSVADPVGAFFFGLLIGFVAGIYLFTVRAGRSLKEMWPIRIETQIPKTAVAVWRGTVTAIKIAIPAMMAFLYLAFILSLLSNGLDTRSILSAIPTMLALMVLWTGIDTGFLGFVIAMQLFLGAPLVGILVFTGPSFGSGNPAWLYSGIAIPLVALFIAGMRIARETQPATPAESARKGALIGIPLALVCLLFASLHSAELTGAFVGRAFLVPFLWGGASALGAFFEAGQRAPEQPLPDVPA